MPPPRGTPNPIEGPGDYDMVPTIHNDTYPAIDPSKADLSGKAVFVSGASKSLGKAMAIAFAKGGASYIALGARSDVSNTERDCLSAAAASGRPAPQILPLKFDVTSVESVDNAATEVRKAFGRIDIIINNAGILSRDMIKDSDPEVWWNTWNVNLRGPYLVTRAFLPLMLEGGEKTFITVSSVGAHCIGAGLNAYQPSKLAVLRFTEFICAEYAEQGVLAFSIHPGNIPTDIVGGPENLPDFLKPVFVETAELSADSLVYLTSEKRDWLAGRYINCTWDLPKLMAKKEEIVKDDKLKVRMVI
ncbi:NAD(P)-binding protein [Viridothelium virens]|uniref:NAD(P)-binding protein n=1 Tax=Viridothelium virens TaxID=1048519 RepID=A0A6A6HAH7_VIRVR|nr:NAD(P)-binding protein [Viridothelium virens]